jgi:hypothetical protein
MQLSQLLVADPLTMSWHSKRSLLQLHLLFLGLFIEPHRRNLLDLGMYRLGNTRINSEDLDKLRKIEEQCVSAARQSARVASLLQIDNLIRSRCWVSMYVIPNMIIFTSSNDIGFRFTSFNGCAVLLFSASQKLLEHGGEEIGYDLSYASSHLNVLSLCSHDNAIARQLYIPLQIVFNDIREVMVSPVYRKIRDMHIVIKDEALVPPSYYDEVEGAKEVSRIILDLTRRINNVLRERLEF